jgi:hypothetical protein
MEILFGKIYNPKFNFDKFGKGGANKLSLEHKINLSKTQNTTGYFRVYKMKKPDCKQGFIWRYRYYDDNGKRKTIDSVDIKKLEKKVKDKGLVWRYING